MSEQKTQSDPNVQDRGASVQSDRGGQAARPGTSIQRAAPRAILQSERGNTEIADQVVAKIAGYAAREIPGVHEMGTGMARMVGGLRGRVPGQEAGPAMQGVSVEVGERQCAIDLDVVTEYGQSIIEISEAMRRNVIERIEGMTGLEVKEVNIRIDDLFVEGLDSESSGNGESRVE